MNKASISGTEMVKRLKDVAEDSIVFVSYLAGRRPSTQALRECSRAGEEGISPRHFTGHFKKVWVTKRGEPVLSVWVEERDSKGRQGAFRTFNPSLGKLLSLEVLAPPAQQTT
jgi:hypothetical protein